MVLLLGIAVSKMGFVLTILSLIKGGKGVISNNFWQKAPICYASSCGCFGISKREKGKQKDRVDRVIVYKCVCKNEVAFV